MFAISVICLCASDIFQAWIGCFLAIWNCLIGINSYDSNDLSGNSGSSVHFLTSRHVFPLVFWWLVFSWWFIWAVKLHVN